MRPIDGDALYEHAKQLEDDAIETIIKMRDSKKQSMIWFAILNERSVFKFDVMDAPTIELPDWQSVVEAFTNELQIWIGDLRTSIDEENAEHTKDPTIELRAYADCLSMLNNYVHYYIKEDLK